MSHVVRKPAFCICENKDADQLCGNRADQRLCFRYTDSTIPLLSKFQASNHLLWLCRLVCVRPGRKPRRPVFSQRGSYIQVGICGLRPSAHFTSICISHSCILLRLLAHLSRRLTGELIVYKGIRRPSSVRPSSVNIFKRHLL